MQFELKALSPEGIKGALQKVERYRLLNEPWEAESICRDLLETEPDHQEGLVQLILCLTDRFKVEGQRSLREARELVSRLGDAYDRAYYSGIISERRGTSIIRRNVRGTGPIAYRWLREAMEHFEEAEELSPPDNEDALIRWNTCARLIMEHRHVRPAPEIREREMFLE